ncbi:MAG: hypothetical protein B6229_06550 [Spirochaetaceae bacterium 4572_7]|nr:MAG: hypothetical protein B6229_06550 [Spirochaetaceae bacterium 4572_7]
MIHTDERLIQNYLTYILMLNDVIKNIENEKSDYAKRIFTRVIKQAADQKIVYSMIDSDIYKLVCFLKDLARSDYGQIEKIPTKAFVKNLYKEKDLLKQFKMLKIIFEKYHNTAKPMAEVLTILAKEQQIGS